MNETYLLELGQRALLVYLQLAGPILVFSLGVGLMVSIVQAVTQVQDMTLTFVPKILATLLAFVLFGPFMMRMIVRLTYSLITNMPNLVR